MILKRSKTGIPYIEFDNENRFAFGQKDPKGYKSLVFSGKLDYYGSIRNGNGRSNVIRVKDRISFFTDFNFSDIKRDYRKYNPFLGTEWTDLLTDFLKNYIDDDGYISDSKIDDDFAEKLSVLGEE